MLDYRYKTFLTVCALGSYTKAADSLAITQPAVSQHIRYLEKWSGGKLLEFKDKKIKITPRGEALRRYTITMQADSDHVQQLMKQNPFEKQQVVFGATLTIGEYSMPPILESIIRDKQDLFFSMLVENTERLLEKLQQGKIQFALVEGFFNKAEYDSFLLSEEDFIAVGVPRTLRNHTLEGLMQERLILREEGSGTREIFEKELRKRNLALKSFSQVCEVGNMNGIKQLVAAGHGITFMYRAAAEKEIQAGTLAEIPLQEFAVKHEFNFVYLKNSLHKKEYENWFFYIKQRLEKNRVFKK